MNPKKKVVLIGFLGLFSVYSFAADIFPIFHKMPITIRIPTNTTGYRTDAAFEVGTNVIYTLNGQLFTNAAAGQIQTLSSGFSGATDRATPWKTVTELLAVYQQGANSNDLRQLYTAGSQSFINEIFSDSDTRTRFQSFATSITNMQVLMGFDLSNGYCGIVSFHTLGNPPDKMPLFFVQTNGQYLLSTFESSGARESNIGVFLNTQSVTNLIQ